jgi:hypothetical protein
MKGIINDGLVPLGLVYEGEILLPDGRVISAGPPTKNLVPQAGVNHFVGLLRGTTAPISAWYIGVYEGNFVPSMSTTAADLPLLAQESQAYSEAARPVWGNTYDGVGSISSRNSRADFTFTADKRLHGAFVISNSSKGGNSGLLLSIVRFQSPIDVPAGSVYRLGASLALIPSI